MAILKEPITANDDDDQDIIEMDKLLMEKFGSKIETNGKINLPDPSLVGVYEIQIVLSSNKTILYSVDLHRGHLARKQSPSNECDCRVNILANDLIALLSGKLDFAQGFLSGKLRIEHGTQASAFKFLHLLMDIASTSSSSSTNSSKSEESAKHLSDGLKSDIIFSIIKKHIGKEPELIRQMPFVIEINLTKNGQKIAKWILNTKINDSGDRIERYSFDEVVNVVKTDAAITIDDDDLASIMLGKLNPQRLFISGRMKIKGNIMLLQRLNQFWTRIQSSKQGSDFAFIRQLLLENQFESGLESEMIFFDWIERLVGPNVQLANTTIRLVITKNTDKKIEWVIVYDSNNNLSSIKRAKIDDKNIDYSNNSNQTIAFIMDDQEFCRLVRSTNHNLMQSIKDGHVNVIGENESLLSKVSKLFDSQIADNDHHYQQQQHLAPAVALKAKL